MNRLEIIVNQVLDDIRPKHTEGTFASRKAALTNLLRFAEEKGFAEPCQELYDAFTSDDRGSVDIRFHLTHAVRLVDEKAHTMAKDRNGVYYNEPPLPSIEDAIAFFEASGFPIADGTDIGYLIAYSEHVIKQYGLSISTIGQYRHAWIDIRRSLYDQSETSFNENLIRNFVDNCNFLHDQGKMKDWKWKMNRKAALVLVEVARSGSFQWGTVSRCSYSCGSDAVDSIKASYIEHQRSRNLEETTLELHEYVFRYAIKHGHISSTDELYDLVPDTVTTIIKGFSDSCNARSMATILPILRTVLDYLHNAGYVAMNLSGMVMPAFVQKNHLAAYIPSDMDNAIIDGLEKESLRNRAMILLAFRLGLRDVDICQLKFSSIDWENDKIKVSQKKTDEILVLPLLPDVGNALMGYIVKERPLNDDGYPYVFRREQAPYGRLNSMYMICSRFISKNGLSTTNGSTKGAHVFRHTLVNRMLRAKVPHQVITDSIGHRSKESDKAYIAMEPDMLKSCALDLSLVGIPSWKGGAGDD